jgi:amidase
VTSNRPWGHLRAPQPNAVAEYATKIGLTLTSEELQVYTDSIASSLLALDQLEELPDYTVTTKYHHRDAGRRPTPAEDPLNAVIQMCEVRGAADGPLAGKTLGVKDCIAVAGVPMTNGGRRQPVLVPVEDAVVIERLLDAGVTVTAKTNLEDLGWGLGEGSAYGPALNPFDNTRSTGGSSSGSGAAVASGMVDLALGADEGGSVRIPAAWCGLVGMKATHGLVPSYGMSYMNHTLDHIGPMSKTVMDNALMLEAMAGPDWRDPQWTRDLPRNAGAYSATAERGISGIKIGILVESLEPVGATDDVLSAFELGSKTLAQLGATVGRASVPMWTSGWALLHDQEQRHRQLRPHGPNRSLRGVGVRGAGCARCRRHAANAEDAAAQRRARQRALQRTAVREGPQPAPGVAPSGRPRAERVRRAHHPDHARRRPLPPAGTRRHHHHDAAAPRHGHGQHLAD